MLHRDFTATPDLILCSVRQYTARYVTRHDGVTTTASSYGAVLDGFSAALGDTLRQEAPLHRLCADLRAQPLFREAFRADVGQIDSSLQAMIWRVSSRLAQLSGWPVRWPSAVVCAVFDGLFQHALLRHLSGDSQAVAALQAKLRLVVGQPVGPAALGAQPVEALPVETPQAAAHPVEARAVGNNPGPGRRACQAARAGRHKVKPPSTTRVWPLT